MYRDEEYGKQSARIKAFAAAAYRRGREQPEDNASFRRDLYEGFTAIYKDLPLRERQARSLGRAMERLPVYLFPDEHLVGMVYHLGPTPEHADPFDYSLPARHSTERLLPENAELVAMNLFTDGGFPGHVTWRWDWVLERGLLGILEEHRRAAAGSTGPIADYHQATVLLLESVLRWQELHVKALSDKMHSSSGKDKLRLEKLLSVCSQVPAHPARSFHEAVQSFYFQYLAVMREDPYGGNGPGRLDYFLWPFLEADLRQGRTTMQEAAELVDELFIRIDERVAGNDGHVETIVVGGCHPDGSSAVNPLSHIMVESLMGLEMTHPSVYMRLPEEKDEEFLSLAARYITDGRNRAQILSDGAVVRAMNEFGVALEDARMYTCGGCMELTPQGMNSDLLFAATCNIAKLVELVISGGECLLTGERLVATSLPGLTGCKSFAELFLSFEEELAREMSVIFRRLDIYSEAMAEHRPAFLLSALTLDCPARGKEMHDGGARYHDYGVTPLGIPDAADMLYVLKRAVFDDGLCSADELLKAMKENFRGQEELRLRLQSLPRFGRQDAEADAMAARVLETICRTFAVARNRLGGRIKPIIFTFVWAPAAGASLGASPAGSLAGRPIAHGLTPHSSSMTAGITAAIASHASLPLHKVGGGASTMWDLDAAYVEPDTVKALLEAFVELGGQIFQGNTTDVDELLRARARPDDYGHVIVRVGGFSAFFCRLSPEVQEDVIARRRHAG